MTALVTSRRTPTSTTAHELRKLRTRLLILTVVVLGTSFAVFEGTRQTTESATERTVPAIMAVSAAAQSLELADSVAMRSFSSGQVLITGPGSTYQAQISLAAQNLEQIAEANAAEPNRDQLLLINSRLTEYRGLVEQAHADYAAGLTQLGKVEMIYASQLMRDKVLKDLAGLRELEQQELAGYTSSFWMSAWALLMWLLPVLALLVFLWRAHRFLKGRFRRKINRSLAVAALLLLLLAVSTVISAVTSSQLDDTRVAVEQLVDQRKPKRTPILSSDTTDPISLRLDQQCDTNHPRTCGVATLASPYSDQVETVTRASRLAAAAAESLYLELVIPALGLLIGALVLAGLQPRIDEYRRRST